MRAVEYLSSTALAAWAGYYLVPKAESGNRVYREFLDVELGTGWVVLMLAVALARIAALYVNGRWMHSPAARLIAGAMAVFIWGFLALNTFTIAPAAQAATMYLIVAVFDAIACALVFEDRVIVRADSDGLRKPVARLTRLLRGP